MSNFKFKPFDEMTDEDYAEVGFKSGLEVHQQLLTKRKLFCRCPAGQYSQEVHAEILRHMRPTLSELGEYDGTALMEFKTKKDVIYQINRDTVCTYEMDDTPPFAMDEDALDIAIEIGMMLDANIVDELHIARKQYLDGSIPTGFQRTAIVSVGGRFPYKDRFIDVIQMSIEEDSCREKEDRGHTRVYNTDRLGMPLIETVTHPQMYTPQEVAEVNTIIRKLNRSTGHVRTGIGAGREDVNVSVRGGTRIEIKGVHKIKAIPLLTHNEAMRQWNLLRLRTELHARGINEETFASETFDITKFLKKTAYMPIATALSEGKIAKCVLLKGFEGLLSWQTQTDTFFAREISDRVRVIACLDSSPNIINSDSNENALSTLEGKKIRKFIGATDKDTLVIVWGNETDTDTGSKEIAIRAKEATIGIPSETRQALRDGTNGFERILPGPERMYPDTDLPPTIIEDDRKAKLKSALPAKFWDREVWYKELGIPTDTIEVLSISAYADLFDKIVKEWKIDPVFASVAIVQYRKRLKKKGLCTHVAAEDMQSIFEALRDGKIIKDAFYTVLESVMREEKFTDEMIPTPATDDDINAAVKEAKEELKSVTLFDSANFALLHTDLVMDKLRGRVSGEKIAKMLNANSTQEA
ncbi:MAG: Glu-tRNA(Gln) amidotransferase subunit GatE [Chlorobi bacterium]|nr:Glu-tRNA(Gln) amidotransferase subunit GatE [Chlorobiota bacterium]